VAKVMIVDDTAMMRSMLKQMIEELGHTVVAEASNGEDALKLFPLKQPDLVTMDVTMPQMDGISVLRKMKLIDPNVKVLMCSAMDRQDLIIEAISLGAKDFIVKPLQKTRAMETIRKILSE